MKWSPTHHRLCVNKSLLWSVCMCLQQAGNVIKAQLATALAVKLTNTAQTPFHNVLDLDCISRVALQQPCDHLYPTAQLSTKQQDVASMNIIVCTLVHPQVSPSATPNKDNTSTPPAAEESTQWRDTCVECIHGAQTWKTNKQSSKDA